MPLCVTAPNPHLSSTSTSACSCITRPNDHLQNHTSLVFLSFWLVQRRTVPTVLRNLYTPHQTLERRLHIRILLCRRFVEITPHSLRQHPPLVCRNLAIIVQIPFVAHNNDRDAPTGLGLA
jgi:hypothetical protein